VAKNKFGIILKQLRIARGLSERQLALRVGVSISYISKIENGAFLAPSANTISKIASTLKADVNELLNLAGKLPHEIGSKARERAILEFGPKLTELRRKSGLSQLKLARQANVDTSYISKLENGKMPPPSRKVLLRLAKALRVSKNELITIAGKAPYVLEEKKGASQMFRDIYRSAKGNIHLPNLSPTMNKEWVRVAISILLVIGIGASLWFAPTTARALSITFLPSPLPAGTLGSTYSFTVRIDIENTDLLPVKSVDLNVYNVANSAHYDKYTGLALADTGYISYATSGVGNAASIMADAASTWGPGYGYRYGYGYAEPGGWDTYQLGYGYGYGYGYSPYLGTTSMVYYVRWTPPSGWPSGDYKIKVDVNGNGTTFTQTSDAFTLSAAAPTPTPTPGDGVPSVTSSEDVSDIVDEDGVFTRSATVTSADGNAIISVPRGTTGLTAEGEPLSSLTITNVSPPAPPSGTNTIGINFDIGPSGATFDPYAELTFEYNPNWLPPGATPDNLTIAYYDADTGRWVELDASDIVIDPTTNRITAKVKHLTIFSVLVRMSPAAFEISGLKISPTSADVAEKVTISVTVANTGDLTSSYEVVLKINGKAVGTKKVSVAGGDSEQVTFTTVQGQQ